MEEELHERPLYRRFVGLEGAARMPDESTNLRFRHLLEEHELAPQVLCTINAGLARHGLMLKTGTVVDATIIAAPSSTKNETGKRDPEMHQTKKGNQWHSGMKAHIRIDAESGLVHTVIGTAANVNDVTQAGALLHGRETAAFGDAGYRGADKRRAIAGWRLLRRRVTSVHRLVCEACHTRSTKMLMAGDADDAEMAKLDSSPELPQDSSGST